MAWDTNFKAPTGNFFTPVELRQLETLFRAIQPTDAARGIPGADECGAARFLDLLLQRDNSPIKIHEDLDTWKKNYKLWLPKLDDAAQKEFSKALASLSIGETTTLLDKLERQELPAFGEKDAQLNAFDTLWRHCLQGCWSDPRWGGNADRIMWRWLGYLEDAKPVTVGAGASHAEN